MPKTKAPDLADWDVVLADGHSLTVRATSLIAIDGWVYLRDTYQGVLFAAPCQNVRFVRRLETPPAGEPVPEPVAASALADEPPALNVPAAPRTAKRSAPARRTR